MKKRTLSALCLATILVTSFGGCGDNAPSDIDSRADSQKTTTSTPWTAGEGSINLMQSVTAGEIPTATVPTEAENVKIMDFSLRLFQNCLQDGENTLVSPLSVLSALGMTANGADGDTLAQMEATFGLTTEEMNRYLYAYTHDLPQGEKYKLSPANAIWFRDREGLFFEEDFLQTNADWYDAGLYRAPFDDSTLKEINEWVETKTDGMIKDILDEIPRDAIMYLVNALAFDAEWETIYNESQIRDGIFTATDGKKQETELMYSEEYCYMDDGNATGFVKYYADRAYAFVALLPNENVSLEEYAASLTGEHLDQLFAGSQNIMVNAAIPKFQCEFSTEMGEVLKSMGMTDAFNSSLAVFSRLGHSDQGNIYISRVLHKTYIAVDEKGTKAGAATVVEAQDEAAPLIIKSVRLDRPFVYMLIDCRDNLPVFIGALNHLEQ